MPASSNPPSSVSPCNSALAFLTADTPGIGGVIKERPEDFLVDEQPLYQPNGKGEHLYLFIEKREQTTSDVLRKIARAFRVANGEVGYAGLKDKHAVTRQHFSVRLPKPGADADGLAAAQASGLKVIWSERHENKLRRGHLAGNRFVIRIRKVEPSRVIHVKRILDRLTQTGAPNYVGEQRFGYRGDNHEVGARILKGDWQGLLDQMLGQPRPEDFEATRAAREAYDRRDYAGALALWPRHHRSERQALDALRQGRSAQSAAMAIDRQQRDFFISALQSAVFNDVLHRRITAAQASAAAPGIGRIVAGDLAWKHDSRAVFAVDEATAAKENAPDGRVPKLEVSPSGPMWGVGMTQAGGDVAREESDALARAGLATDQLAGGSQGRADGSRRPMRMPIKDADVSAGADEHGPYIRLAFELPRGCFATAVLREIMKTTAAQTGDDANEE